eukprot:GHVU01040881.1.p1 GENE.GHVU01040881.1~~GHVU01040881.1.p1  ORF type:complete len:736 (+),score=55.13 GHVU01040881.1:2131-4338(+)
MDSASAQIVSGTMDLNSLMPLRGTYAISVPTGMRVLDYTRPEVQATDYGLTVKVLRAVNEGAAVSQVIEYPYTPLYYKLPGSSPGTVPHGISGALAVGRQWTMGSYEAPMDDGYTVDNLLRLFSDVATQEARGISREGSPWEQIYYDVPSTPHNNGTYGNLYGNSIFFVHEHTDSTKIDFDANPAGILSYMNYDGLVCPLYTPHSIQAGSMRQLTLGAWVFVITQLTSVKFSVVDAALGSAGRFLYNIGGHARQSNVSHTDFMGVMARSQMSVRGAPCFYLRGNILYVQAVPGMVVRIADTEAYGPLWVNSDILTSGSAMAFLGMIPLPLSSRFCPMVSLIPFVRSSRPHRTLLSLTSIPATVAYAGSSTRSYVKPQWYSIPFVLTEFAKRLEEAEFGSFNGFNLRVLYMNSKNNYEDAIMMLHSTAERIRYHTTKTFAVRDLDVPVVNQSVTDTLKWYTCPTRGVVIKVEPPTIERTSHLVTILTESSIKTGDKICTYHGQKGVVVVCDALPTYRDMMGVMHQPDVLISVTAIVNRVTGGQVIEGAYGIQAAAGYTDVTMGPNNIGGSVVVPLEDAEFRMTPERLAGIINCFPLRADGSFYRYVDGKTLVASTGVVRFGLQHQFAADKLHYTTAAPSPNALHAVAGRRAGGSIRGSEMMFLACDSAGLPNVVKELRERGNCVVIKVCGTCNRQATLCRCSVPQATVEVKCAFPLPMTDHVVNCVHGMSFEYKTE